MVFFNKLINDFKLLFKQIKTIVKSAFFVLIFDKTTI